MHSAWAPSEETYIYLVQGTASVLNKFLLGVLSPG